MYKKIISTLLIIVSFLNLTINVLAQPETIENQYIEDVTVDRAMKAVAKPNQNWECLNIVDPEHSKSAQKTEKIQLKGQCSSPGGCVAVICQGTNEAFKQEHQARLDSWDEKGINSIRSKKKQNDLLNYPGAIKNWINSQRRRAQTKKIESLCTTGNSQLDIQLFGKDNTNRSLKFGLLGFVQNVVDKAKGLIDNVLGDSTVANNLNYGQVEVDAELAGAGDEVTYAAYAVSLGDLTTTQVAQETAEGEARTQQQSQFATSFNFSDIDGVKQTCARIMWDPYGRVFDAQSLEPVADAVVTILDESKVPLPEDRIPSNNYWVGSNGFFNILIDESGYYYLTVEPFTDHEFTKDVQLHPSYSKMYYDIYYPDTKFYEKTGELTHHDIPLKPIGEPYRSTPVIYPETIEQKSLNGYNQFAGQNSHPLATICLKGKDSNKNYACAKSDRYGFFQIFINDKDYPQEVLIPTITKADLNNPEAINQSVQKLSTVIPTPDPYVYVDMSKVKYEPILKYIEGYIYDQDGKVIPKAEVRIILDMADSIYYKTTADDSGFITIYRSSLPSLDYHIEIIDPKTQTSRVIKNSDFIKDNKSYLDGEKINLAQGTKNDQPVILSTGTLNPQAFSENNKNNINQLNKQELGADNKQKLSGPVIVAVLIIFVLVAIVVGVIIYIKKNDHSFKP